MTRKAKIALLVLFSFSILAGLILAIFRLRDVSLGDGASGFSISKKVGLIKVSGVIENPEQLSKKLREMRDNESIPAVVLRINSPGGVVGAAQEIYAEVVQFAKADKPLVVSMGNVAASGGYYIACPAHTIFANPGTITGSIGVIMQIPNAKKLLDKIGLDEAVVKSGDFKDAGRLSKELTPAERRLLQSVVDDTYEQFLEAISLSRSIPKNKLRKFCDGRIFTGRQAQRYGLVDSLGTLQQAIAYAGALAGITGKPKIHEPKSANPRSFFERFLWDAAGKLTNLGAGSADSFLLRYQMKM